VDVLGERVTRCLSECPGGGTAAVVPERDCGVEVFGFDGLLSVEQGVEEREPDDVRFGAGGELAEEPVRGMGELRVDVPPQLASVSVQREPAGGSCVGEDGGEVAAKAGVFQRVGVTAFG
jgi:hypothetical protein